MLHRSSAPLTASVRDHLKDHLKEQAAVNDKSKPAGLPSSLEPGALDPAKVTGAVAIHVQRGVETDPAIKAKLVQEVLADGSHGAAKRVAAKYGISQSTLHKWMKDAQHQNREITAKQGERPPLRLGGLDELGLWIDARIDARVEVALKRAMRKLYEK